MRFLRSVGFMRWLQCMLGHVMAKCVPMSMKFLKLVGSSLKPFDNIAIDPVIAALPKADIHIHPEWSPRLDRVLAKREGREPYNWRAWAENLMQTEPPGEARLRHISSHFPAPDEADSIPENFVARV